MSERWNLLGLGNLSVTERISLAAELSDSVVNAENGPKLSDAQKLDLQRRLNAYRDNPKAGSPWEEVKARLLMRSSIHRA